MSYGLNNITIVDGNIFNSKADVICHQVNCKGIMGGGIAKQIKSKFPFVYKQYRLKCAAANNNPDELLGDSQFVPLDRNNKNCIANLFGQNECGSGYVCTDYDALYQAMIKTVNLSNAMYPDGTIAIPYKIGCGLAGGDWDVVLKIIGKAFSSYSGKVQIWHLPENN